MNRLLLLAIFALGTAAAQEQQPFQDQPEPLPVLPAVTASQFDLPQTLQQRWDRYLYRTYSWQRMAMLGVDTGTDTLLGDVAWGRGLDGFGCRYAHRFGRRVVGNSIEFGVSALLREDTRYRPLVNGSNVQRMRHAAKSAFVAYRDDGHQEFAIARFAGFAGRALVSPSWQPKPLTPVGGLIDVGSGVFDQVQNNLLSEFTPDLKHFGGKVWKSVRAR